MDKVRSDALAYYNSMTKEKKQAVSKFFKALDDDGNGTVSLAELAEFLANQGVYICDSPVDTFRMFDRDGNGSLDFDEVVTLFYYLTVGPGAQKWALRRSNSRNLEKWKAAREAMQFVTVSYNFGNTIGSMSDDVESIMESMESTDSCSIL